MLKCGVKCTSSNQLAYVPFLSFLLLFVVDCTLLALHQEPVVKKVPLPVYVSYFLNAIGKQGRIVPRAFLTAARAGRRCALCLLNQVGPRAEAGMADGLVLWVSERKARA